MPVKNLWSVTQDEQGNCYDHEEKKHRNNRGAFHPRYESLQFRLLLLLQRLKPRKLPIDGGARVRGAQGKNVPMVFVLVELGWQCRQLFCGCRGESLAAPERNVHLRPKAFEGVIVNNRLKTMPKEFTEFVADFGCGYRLAVQQAVCGTDLHSDGGNNPARFVTYNLKFGEPPLQCVGRQLLQLPERDQLWQVVNGGAPGYETRFSHDHEDRNRANWVKT